MEIRLNKYLSEAGVCSRREADRLIESGKVTVDGKRAETGMKITEGQVVCVGKQQVKPKDEMVLLAVNKPVGIVCTEEKREKNNIIQFLNYLLEFRYHNYLHLSRRCPPYQSYICQNIHIFQCRKASLFQPACR